ncbi:MAG: hypothetical protein MK214_09845 [Thalassotalea sp.]|nr:hypothetical protein [Thalassotalea sp.]
MKELTKAKALLESIEGGLKDSEFFRPITLPCSFLSCSVPMYGVITNPEIYIE